MKILKKPNIKEWKYRQMQRVRAEEAFKVAIMLVDLELRKLS